MHNIAEMCIILLALAAVQGSLAPPQSPPPVPRTERLTIPMMPPVEPVASDTRLPERVDAVVIGGGIIGVAAAYFLAKQGRSVALVAKGRVGAEQSSRNWGWCRTQNRDQRELPLQLVSMGLWDDLSAAVGADMGFRRTGLIYATKSEEELATWSAWVEMARAFQVRNRVLTPAETKALTPGN